MANSIIWHSWCFFINENHIRPSCRYKIVYMYSKIPKWFRIVILNDCLCLMFIPFWFNVGSICSANFPRNPSFDPIMPSVVLYLSKFETFTYNVVNCLIIPTAHSTFCLLLWFVNLPFNYTSLIMLVLRQQISSFLFHDLGSHFSTTVTYRESLLP